MLRRLIGIVFSLALLAIPASAADTTITGTVSYRERIALPANAQLRVVLVDLQTGAQIVGAATAIPKQVPIGFSLNVRSDLAPDRAYGIIAEISSEGRVMFRSQQPVPVDLVSPATIDVMVQFSPDPPHDPPPTLPLPPPALVDVVWTVTSIGGRPVTGTRPLTLSIAPDNRVGGSGGCNNYFTEATVQDDAIAFGPAAATRMACAEDVITQEAAYFAALAAVTKFELDGKSLRLLDPAGVPLVGLVQNQE